MSAPAASSDPEAAAIAPPAPAAVAPAATATTTTTTTAAAGKENKKLFFDDDDSQGQNKIVVDPVVAALWGIVPVCARMFMPDAKEGAAAPSDKVLLVPRQGFLLYHMDSIRAHFSPHAANIHSLWLSVRDERTGIHAYVPWYLPTHVIVDRVMSRCEKEKEPQAWGKSFLPLLVFVHFTMPTAVKKKQRADLAAQPELLLTLKDQPGIATLHLYRWLKEVYLTRFNDLEGFEGDSVIAGGIRSLGMRMLRAGKDNDPVCVTSVRRDVLKRAAILGSAQMCVVIHTFDAPNVEKPQWRFKAVRFTPAGRTLGRALAELIPPLNAIPSNVLAMDDTLPPQYGAVFIQGLQPVLTTPFDVIAETYLSTDLALHIVWRPPLRS